ncbi:MAG: hypothetical protein HY289_04370 [Planctomycetes bacterium]|nr:hypothetical protein [Planctomycetota bacterium]
MNMTRGGSSILVLLAAAWTASAQPDDKLDKQRCAKPAEFALVFSYGYSADKMPAEDERFEDLLKRIKDAGFNVIHCPHADKRLALCKKHGVKMMVDLLIENHHVYKNPKGAEALCAKLRDNADVWGYNIWNDPFGKSVEGRLRDIRNVRTWDPTHPAFCGTYRTVGMKGLSNPDVFGYYDFHWKRGTAQHFPHLLAYSAWAKERDAVFYTWLSCTSGLPGKGNFNRSLYSANTGIACGLRGILWFLADDMIDRKTHEWTEIGRDIIRVQRQIGPLAKELTKLSHPTAIYTTTIRTTLNNERIKDGPTMPPGLTGHAFPKDFWLQPMAGEFLLGVFQDDAKRDAIFVANHNAYLEQQVTLRMTKDVGKVRVFNRTGRQWELLDSTNGQFNVQLAPGAGELLRFEK